MVVPLLLALTLAACGDDDGSDSGVPGAKNGFEAVSITGDVGKAPEVEWKGRLAADKPETEVITEGDGEEVEEGDKVEVNVWIGNGFTQKEAYTTYGKKGDTPETFTIDDQLTPIFRDALLGQKIGSRVAVATMSKEVFGEQGNPEMGIGNEDGVLLVLDLMKMFEPPKPVDVNPSRLPKVVEEKGNVTSLDFTGVEEPYAKGNLLRAVVKEGDGEEVTTSSTVTADYLGMVYKGKKPFDESFSGEPAEFSLQQVVQGWTYGLAGLKVGTRVILQIPPALGYGDQEQENIPAGSTLYFVVDIVSAK